MRAMILKTPGSPLEPVEWPTPVPIDGEILVEIAACGVCRTDLHVVDGDLTDPKLPIIPGHEIVGRVAAIGGGVTTHKLGARVGIPWLGRSCGCCSYCRNDHENLCNSPEFTGYTRDGGYATHTVADARYAFAIAGDYSDAEAAPLLCAGLIGYRSLRMAGENAAAIGIYGFGAAAHIVAQIARFEKRRVFAFTRPGDVQAQQFARDMGCDWAGGSDEPAPEPLDAAIIFAPVGALVPAALKAVRKAGTVVCGGIHMSDIPSFPYADLWQERVIRSVANLTRRDAEEFLALAPKAGVRTEIVQYPLSDANAALDDLRAGRLRGAAVLVPRSTDNDPFGRY